MRSDEASDRAERSEEGLGTAKKEVFMEYFDIRNSDGRITGEIKERTKVHEDGDLHGTSHVWIMRQNGSGGYDLLLQKRSAGKDAYPGCYDISSAGHLMAGQDYLPSALRELWEELGIRAKEEDLVFLGIHEGYYEETFYGKPFRNHEISHVYLYDRPVDIEDMILQEDEVESVKWMDIEKCYEETEKNNPRYILEKDELDMIKKYIENCSGQREPSNNPAE